MNQGEIQGESGQKGPQNHMSLSSSTPALARLLEMLLCILCLSLITIPYDNKLFISVHRAGFVYTSFIMPIVVDLVVFISHLRRQPPSKLAICLFSGIFGLMLLGSGASIVNDWNTIIRRPHSHPPKMFMDMMVCSGIFAMLTSLISFANVYLTHKFL